MKKITLLAPAFCLCLNVFAQNVDWLHASNQWYFHIQSGWVGSGIERLWMGATDTVIAGKTYRTIERKAEFSPSGVNHESRRWVRQDGKSIFAIAPYNGDEILLYDFGLEVGDTVLVPLYPDQGGFGYVITGIDTIQIGGQNRLKQEVNWLKGTTNLIATKGTFIEGIGGVEGLYLIDGVWTLFESYFFPDEPGSIATDGESRIFCSFQNDQIQFEGAGKTFCAALATDTPDAAKVTIFPNPSRGTLQISSENNRQITRIDIFDVAGRLIESHAAGDSGEITSSFKGLAIVVVRMENGLAQRLIYFR